MTSGPRGTPPLRRREGRSRRDRRRRVVLRPDDADRGAPGARPPGPRGSPRGAGRGGDRGGRARRAFRIVRATRSGEAPWSVSNSVSYDAYTRAYADGDRRTSRLAPRGVRWDSVPTGPGPPV